MRMSSASGWLARTAHISAVDWTESLALTLAPRSNSSFTASVPPSVRAAIISAVVPCGSGEFGSAPASRSRLRIRALAFEQARETGVTPYRFEAFGSAPDASNDSTVRRSSARTAQCRGVVPSGDGAFTLAGSLNANVEYTATKITLMAIRDHIRRSMPRLSIPSRFRSDRGSAADPRRPQHSRRRSASVSPQPPSCHNPRHAGRCGGCWAFLPRRRALIPAWFWRRQTRLAPASWFAITERRRASDNVPPNDPDPTHAASRDRAPPPERAIPPLRP